MLSKKEADKLKRRYALAAERDAERGKRDGRIRKYVAKQRKRKGERTSAPKKDVYARGKRISGSFGSRQ